MQRGGAAYAARPSAIPAASAARAALPNVLRVVIFVLFLPWNRVFTDGTVSALENQIHGRNYTTEAFPCQPQRERSSPRRPDTTCAAAAIFAPMAEKRDGGQFCEGPVIQIAATG